MELKCLVSVKIASETAAAAHKNQVRKDKSTPYVIHPARVAALVSGYGGTPAGIIAAWLHDVVEDCTNGGDIVREALAEMPISGREKEEIRATISCLTKNSEIRNKRDRLIDSLERIRTGPPEAALVKLCDRIDNLVDSRVRGPVFIEEYLAYTDDIIRILEDRAMAAGYRSVFEDLVRIRQSIER